MISIQVQDASLGLPAPRIPVELDVFVTGYGWKEVGHGLTEGRGRIDDFAEPAAPGLYRLMFDIASYQPTAFFPSIPVIVEVQDPHHHVHLVLAISPFSYTVHRGLEA